MKGMQKVQIHGVTFSSPVANAAGIRCKTVEEVRALSRTPVGGIWSGSFTVKPRRGNPGITTWIGTHGALNSAGLPSGGAPYCEKYMEEMVEIAHAAGKPFIASAAGFTPKEYATLTEIFLKKGADGVELDLGCPNVWHGDVQKKIPAFDPEVINKILKSVEEVRKVFKKKILIIPKLSPIPDPCLLREVGSVIAAFPMVGAVTAINTFPNAFAFNSQGKPAINTGAGGGLAGFVGSGLKYIGLGQVFQLRQILPPRIDIIGVGGVEHGKDIYEYKKAGASMVLVGTAFLKHGSPVFKKILAEYSSFLK